MQIKNFFGRWEPNFKKSYIYFKDNTPANIIQVNNMQDF